MRLPCSAPQEWRRRVFKFILVDHTCGGATNHGACALAAIMQTSKPVAGPATGVTARHDIALVVNASVRRPRILRSFEASTLGDSLYF